MDRMIIAYSKRAVLEVNKLLNGGNKIKVGSKVIIKRSKSELAPVGSITYVDAVTETQVVVNGVTLSKSHVELAYAMTTMSSEGSAWDDIVFLAGTAPSAVAGADCYVGVTRARNTVTIFHREDLDTTVRDLIDVVYAEEGNRNNKLYRSVGLLKTFMSSLGLSESEITKTIDSANGTPARKIKNKKGIKSAEKCQLRSDVIYTHLPFNPSTNTTIRSKNEKHFNTPVKAPKGKVLTQLLQHGNQVVVDCDTPETCAKFQHLVNTTHALVGEGTMHLTFTVEALYSSKHKDGVDFLGNRGNSIRFLKENKKWNGLAPALLP